jgi:YaeC family lipoprotein
MLPSSAPLTLQQTGLTLVRDSVFIEDKNLPYVNIVVTREDNKDAKNVKEFIESYQSSEVAKAAETIFNGGAVLGWYAVWQGRRVRKVDPVCCVNAQCFL